MVVVTAIHTRNNASRCHAGTSCNICLHESPRCTGRSCNATCPSHMLTQTAPACSSASVRIGDWCEGDGECDTKSTLNNCPGGYDVYQRISPSGARACPLSVCLDSRTHAIAVCIVRVCRYVGVLGSPTKSCRPPCAGPPPTPGPTKLMKTAAWSSLDKCLKL